MWENEKRQTQTQKHKEKKTDKEIGTGTQMQKRVTERKERRAAAVTRAINLLTHALIWFFRWIWRPSTMPPVLDPSISKFHSVVYLQSKAVREAVSSEPVNQ